MNWKKLITDLIYPTRCPCCSKIISYKSDFCSECRSKITPYTAEHEIKGCIAAYAVCVYNDNIKEAVFLLKGGVAGNGPYAFASGLNEIIEKNGIKADLICPIPMFSKDIKKRGYNQCSLISAELSALSGIKWSDNALIKIKSTDAQKNLSAAERKQNLFNAFYADKEKVKNRKIILIDDICTTGATLEAAAKALNDSGAAEIYALTYCKAV